jgi:hypothetical protein
MPGSRACLGAGHALEPGMPQQKALYEKVELSDNWEIRENPQNFEDGKLY